MTAEERKYLKRTYDAERKSAERYYDHGIVAIEDLLVDDDSDEGKNELFSDGGKGAEAIYDGGKPTETALSIFRRKKHAAYKRIADSDTPEANELLQLLIKFNGNAKEIVWHMAHQRPAKKGRRKNRRSKMRCGVTNAPSTQSPNSTACPPIRR